ncbi:hypothetical protein [Streptomyces sp. NPDC002855]|uniref:hypothetical protein n=1 Tax=Streptomyces sp. NPDC002855 TaxID=3154437 RepID=UPI00332BC924
MAQVTPDDFREIQRKSRAYCRAVDGTRSRKRMDGSATVSGAGFAPYGTDDVSDDVTQDAVLRFAKRLGEVTGRCAVAAQWIATHAPAAWQYTRRDGHTIVVNRATLQYWAVRDAAAVNGYRLDVQPDDVDAQPGAQTMRGILHADTLQMLAVAPCLAAHSGAIFRAAWGERKRLPDPCAASGNRRPGRRSGAGSRVREGGADAVRRSAEFVVQGAARTGCRRTGMA